MFMILPTNLQTQRAEDNDISLEIFLGRTYCFLQYSFLSRTMGDAGESGKAGLLACLSSLSRSVVARGKWKGRGDCGN